MWDITIQNDEEELSVDWHTQCRMGCKAIDEERIEERIKPRKENCMNCRTRLNPGLLDYGLKMKFKWKYQV